MKKIVMLLCLALTLILGACSSSEGGAEENQTLIIGIESEADVLDPHRASGWVTFRINRQIHESLVAEDLSAEGKSKQTPDIVPGLAKSWEVSEDGLVYTFRLQEGVTFHDGTEFNAEAVAFNFRRVIDEDFEYYDQRSASALMNTISRVESTTVVDEHTIQINMSEPSSSFIRLLAGERSVSMISPTALAASGNDLYAESPVGTGPFKFAERVRGEKIVLTRNEEYWGEKAQLEQVIFQPISNQAARVLALESGQVDIIAVPPPDSIEKLQQSGFVVDSGNPPHIWYLTVNMNNEIMQNSLVRKAIAMAIDRKGMAETLLKGTVKPAYSIQSPANAAYDPDFVDYEYNPEKAMELLAEAGYPNGFDTVFQTSVDGSGQLIPVPMAEWIQQDLAKVGINVELETFEWISYLGMWTNMPEDVGFNQMSWGTSTPFHLYNVAHSDSGANAGKYQNPKVDALIDQALEAMDEESEIGYWKQANQLIAEDAAIIPIVNDTAPYAMASYVKGFVVPNQQWYDLTKVTIED